MNTSFIQTGGKGFLEQKLVKTSIKIHKTMKSLIFLLGVCTFFCVAYASPAIPQVKPYGYRQAQNLLNKITQQSLSTGLSDDSSSALVQAIDQAAMESMTERARAQFWGSLAKHAIGLLGK